MVDKMEVPLGDVPEEAMRAADVPLDEVSPDEPVRKRRGGRKPLPRDEFGNIVRPPKPGEKPPSPPNPNKKQNREQRKALIEDKLHEANPMVVDAVCMIAKIPPQIAKRPVEVIGEDGRPHLTIQLTEFGEALGLPNNVVTMYANTGAHLQETDLGWKAERIAGKAVPYALLAGCIMATAMWALAIMKSREQLMAAAQMFAEQQRQAEQRAASDQMFHSADPREATG
jgi:hypothetical protein